MFICFDTEDDSRELLSSGKSGFDKKVTQIAALTTGGAKFYNRGEVKLFLEWLTKQPEKYVYAHNLQYDLGNLFGEQLDQLDCTLVGGRLIKAVWRNKLFLDSFNIWPMSAKKIGERFGLEKLEFDSKSKEYVFRDVEIIFRAMEFAWKFAAEMEIETLPSTLGGLCVKVWKRFGEPNCHDSNPICKEAYYGGRVELFKQRNDEAVIAYTDINSLYPSVMVREFPAELCEWEADANDLPKYGVIKCKVKVPKTDLAVLPFRNEDGRILFPYGTFSGTWTIFEINEALKRGATILETFEVWGTDESITPYKKFVEAMYDMRLAATTESEKLMLKLLMNNLYGRLGTGGVIGRTVYQTEDNKEQGICYGEKVLVNYQMPLSVETNWCHAAYVTSYGRVALLEYMEKIGAEKMIYCDTDSCIFDCANKAIPFPIGDKLGMMKLESWETECETFAPKAYKYGKKYKAKGVPVSLAELFLTSGRVDFDLPFKMREAIKFYDRENCKRLSVWRKVEKFRRSGYDKKKQKKNRFFPLQIKEG